jgi:uncharacterized integral membrane protein
VSASVRELSLLRFSGDVALVVDWGGWDVAVEVELVVVVVVVLVLVVVLVVVVQLEKSVQSKWFIAQRNTFLHLLHLLSNVVH